MMQRDEENSDRDKPDRNTLMIWALKNAKEGKKIIVGGGYKSNGASKAREPITEDKSKAKPKKKKERIYTKIPTLDDIKDIAPDANWGGRNLLYEACITEQATIVIQALSNQGAPKELLDHLVVLREAIKNGDNKETKNALFNLAENWGGSTSSNNKPNYHLLRTFIRMMYETYPLR